MAILSVTFNNIHNGQEVVLPFDVFGSIAVPPGATGGTTISAGARQIDDNGLVNFTIGSGMTLFPFSLEITAAECTDLNVWYLLTIYAWDSGGDCTMQSVTFKRVAPLGPPSLPRP